MPFTVAGAMELSLANLLALPAMLYSKDMSEHAEAQRYGINARHAAHLSNIQLL